MIKFRKTNDQNGKTILGFGLSEVNVQRLKAGEPIYFNLEQLGEEFAGVEVLIMYGETEATITEQLNLRSKS